MCNSCAMSAADLITKREAADLLEVDLSTVNRMVTKGHLRPAKVISGPKRAAMYLFHRADVQRLKRERKAVAANRAKAEAAA